MNSELDQADGYRGSDEEFEKWLDEIHDTQYQEFLERERAEYLMAQREYERLTDDF